MTQTNVRICSDFSGVPFMNVDCTKTILYVYPSIETLAEAIGESIQNGAVLSYRSRRGALADCERIAGDVLLQKRLLLLKEQVNGFLKTLSADELFLLEYRFFRRKKILQGYSFTLNCTERSYFRRQEKLLKKAAAYFSALGMTGEKFLDDFKNSVCVKKIYKAIREGEELSIYPRREKRDLVFQDSRFSGGTVFLPSATKIAMTSRATEDRVISTI